MAVTIYDIAREAKLIEPSRAFNDSPKVTIETRSECTWLNGLNYQLTLLHRHLHESAQHTLQSFHFSPTIFFIQILQGVQESAFTCRLIIHGSNTQEQLDEYFVRSMRKR